MRRILFITLLTVTAITTTAQKYQSPLYLRGGFSLFASWVTYDHTVFFPGISVAPGIRLIQGDDMAVALSAPLTIGASFKNHDNTFLGLDLPVMMEFNFGTATGNASKPKAGFMLGAGIAFHHAGRYERDLFGDEISYEQVSFFGYRAIAGISFNKEKDGSAPMITFSWGKPFNHVNKALIGIGASFILGNRN